MTIPVQLQSLMGKHIFFTVYLFLFVGVLHAQNSRDSTSYLSFDSNFDSLYVVINDNPASARKIGIGELLEVEAGERPITVVPQYAQTFRFNNRFKADSFYVAIVYFHEIFREPNADFVKLEQGTEVDFSEENRDYKPLTGTFLVAEYSKSRYYGHKLEEGPESENAYLRVASNVDFLYIRPNAFLERTIRTANNDSIPIRPGKRRVALAHPYAGEWSTVIKFEPGKTTLIQHDFELEEPSVSTLQKNLATEVFYDANLIVVSDSDSKISIDGEIAGTGAVRRRVKTGPVRITIDNPETGKHTFTKTIANLPGERAVVVDAYTKPSKGTARFFGVFPGASQFYKRQKLKGGLLAGGFLIMAGLTLHSNGIYQRELEEFHRVERLYQLATDEQKALQYGSFLKHQQTRVAHKDNTRMVLLGITSLIYAFNLYDAVFSRPKSGYRTNTNLRLHLKPQRYQSTNYPSFSLNYGF